MKKLQENSPFLRITSRKEDKSMSNQIEVVRINRLEGEGSIKAFCDISLFDTLIIKGLKVVNGKNGIFVGMPHEQGKDGKWYETVRLLKNDLKEAIEKTVLEAFSA